VLSTSFLKAGSHTITVTYGGASAFAASTSTAVTETIPRAATTTTLSASANPASTGKPLLLSAMVIPGVTGASVATGTITFLDGTTVLGTARIDSTGHAVLTITPGTIVVRNGHKTTLLARGTHHITASYSGDGNLTSSVSATLNLTVV